VKTAPGAAQAFAVEAKIEGVQIQNSEDSSFLVVSFYCCFWRPCVMLLASLLQLLPSHVNGVYVVAQHANFFAHTQLAQKTQKGEYLP
jgi:hypothetical protein